MVHSTFFKLALIIFSVLFISSKAVRADELIMSLDEAREAGYRPVEYNKIKLFAPYCVSSQQILDWPFESFYEKSHMGNNFAQYQPYGKPGYHLGGDMILSEGSSMYAPVDGRLEAGHYGYTDLDNGDRIKQWKPWPETGHEAYFELAVIDKNGMRFEFHHVDRNSLPANIVDGLNSGSIFVKKGTPLGKVYDWSFTSIHYHHVHLNVIDQQGVYYNPESFFKLIPDTIPPDVKVLVEYESGQTRWLEDQPISAAGPVKNIIVSGVDYKNNSEYFQAPLFIELLYGQNKVAELDFRLNIVQENGEFADIRNVYPQQIILPDGTIARQNRGFYPNEGTFYLALSVPSDAQGSFKLNVKDIAGNASVFSGELE